VSDEQAEHFRKWLVERLLGTRFSAMAIDDSRIDEVARLLGVSPELLLEARTRSRIERYERGQPSRRLMSKPGAGEAHHRLYQFTLFMPEVILKAWEEECNYRDVDGPVFLRSLIHSYLLGSREPEPREAWRWKGQRFTMPASDRDRFREKATIPIGAKRALTVRAIRLGTQSTRIVRALVTEALAGGHRGIPLVETAMMYDDEERYLSGSSKRA
jgi:hypothetical protein